MSEAFAPGHEAGPPAHDAEALLELLEDCQRAGVERRALLLRLSLLPRALTRPHHLRLARAALGPLLLADRARLFRLSGASAADLAVVWRGPAETAAQACRDALERLFAGEPQAAPARLAEWLVLPGDAAALLAAIGAGRPAPADPGPAQLAQALDTVRLATLEASLARASVDRFARRRDVCALTPGGRFALRWERRFLSVAEISEALMPDRSLAADPWLFRRLTRTLDQRMLALLAAPGELRGAGAFAIGLNVASIVSPGFLRFDAALPDALRGRVTLEISAPDMLADPAAFLFAREFAQSRRYRLALRGVCAELLGVLPLGRTGLDWLQLRWSGGLAALPSLPCEPDRVVLTRADAPEALAWGRARGIALFCGRLAARGVRAPLLPPPLLSPEAASRAAALGAAAASA